MKKKKKKGTNKNFTENETNLRLKALDFILTLTLQEAWSVATPFSVKIKAITQKDGNSVQAYTVSFTAKFTAQLLLSLEKKKDVNRLEIKDM